MFSMGLLQRGPFYKRKSNAVYPAASRARLTNARLSSSSSIPHRPMSCIGAEEKTPAVEFLEARSQGSSGLRALAGRKKALVILDWAEFLVLLGIKLVSVISQLRSPWSDAVLAVAIERSLSLLSKSPVGNELMTGATFRPLRHYFASHSPIPLYSRACR